MGRKKNINYQYESAKHSIFGIASPRGYTEDLKERFRHHSRNKYMKIHLILYAYGVKNALQHFEEFSEENRTDFMSWNLVERRIRNADPPGGLYFRVTDESLTNPEVKLGSLSSKQNEDRLAYTIVADDGDEYAEKQ